MPCLTKIYAIFWDRDRAWFPEKNPKHRNIYKWRNAALWIFSAKRARWWSRVLDFFQDSRIRVKGLCKLASNSNSQSVNQKVTKPWPSKVLVHRYPIIFWIHLMVHYDENLLFVFMFTQTTNHFRGQTCALAHNLLVLRVRVRICACCLQNCCVRFGPD